ncbi:hypothetical protein HanIR_Chr02g0064721 [Helianthus annuus]|nr:hypothetical protein HanIR_Chr02g0064721 [Helianthus annuus]
MKVMHSYVVWVGDSDSTTELPLGCVKSTVQIKKKKYRNLSNLWLGIATLQPDCLFVRESIV